MKLNTSARELLGQDFLPGGHRPFLLEERLYRRLSFLAEGFRIRNHHLHALALQVDQQLGLSALQLFGGSVRGLLAGLHD